MAINLVVVREAINNQLQPLVAMHEVQIVLGEINLPVGAKRLRVVYKRKKPSEILSFNGLVEYSIFFEVQFRFQDLRSESDCYPVLASAEDLLEGFIPMEYATPMHLTIEEAVPTDLGGVHLYRQIYEFTR